MTVYGQEPRRGAVGRMHPAVLALVAVAVLVAVGIGVWLVTGSSGGTPQPAAAAVTSAPAQPQPSRPSPAPVKLAAGSWLVSPAEDKDSFLALGDDGFAVFSTDQRMVVTVSAGLADDACFSFREPGGGWLRHFDYRLRFDKADDSDLFREDATFCPVSGAPAGTVRLKSKNYPDHVLNRRSDTELYIDETGDAQATAFIVQPA
ncbi:AbfB domain-containing protein [Symbioplanes lichenis]|uniref:AbfB domain-containing protein n=1 Tax=Symbioplanes lichenis TaxID=1629072 RepID=UPI002738D335|nr:AbfB domain-containing protein [Actinoplanes lichenis]